jgi:hypothetical protein
MTNLCTLGTPLGLPPPESVTCAPAFEVQYGRLKRDIASVQEPATVLVTCAGAKRCSVVSPPKTCGCQRLCLCIPHAPRPLEEGAPYPPGIPLALQTLAVVLVPHCSSRQFSV